MENQQGMNRTEYAQARILPERYESFQDFLLLTKRPIDL
jgi:hypothetical protein